MCFEVHGLRALRSEKLTIVVHVHVQIRQVLLASQAALERAIWPRVCKLCKVFVLLSYMPQNPQTLCPKPRLHAKNFNKDVLNSTLIEQSGLVFLNFIQLVHKDPGIHLSFPKP